jgi:hypothetical protein
MPKNSIISRNEIDEQRQKWISNLDIMTNEIIQKEILQYEAKGRQN